MSKRIDRAPYIREHYKTQSAKEMALALGIATSRLSQICNDLGVKPLTQGQKRVNMIREANGTLTIDELAILTGLCRTRVFVLCHRNELPYKRTPCSRFRTGNKAGKGNAGRPKLEPPQVPDAPKKIVRPAATYSNPNFSEHINQLLQV